MPDISPRNSDVQFLPLGDLVAEFLDSCVLSDAQRERFATLCNGVVEETTVAELVSTVRQLMP